MSGPLAAAGRAPLRREIGWVVAASLAVAVAALLLAPVGSTVLYVSAGLVALGLFVWAFRGVLTPAAQEVVARARPRTAASRARPHVRPLPVVLALLVVLAVAVPAAPHALVVLGIVAGAAVLAGVGWLCWPLLHALATPPDGQGAVRRPVGGLDRRATARAYGLVIVLLGPLALILAQLGTKPLIAVIGVAVLLLLVAVVRDRTVFFTFLTVASLCFLLHKSFGQQFAGSMAVSIYVTTFDVLVLLLYGFWVREGTFRADVRAAWRSGPVRLPLVGALLLLPSLLVAVSATHASWELFRMAWMYLLFFYVAVRVRTIRHVWAILGGLTLFALVELVVVLGQWATGGNLGLDFLGLPHMLTQRIFNDGSLGRPFGTIIHPVFMGTVMGGLALIALSLAIFLPRSLTKLVSGVMVGVCTLPLYLAHVRGPTLAVVLVACYIVAIGLRRRLLQWRTLGRIALVGLAVAAVGYSSLSAKFSENFFTGHFWEEIQARWQLNVVAYHMWTDHWLLGVGLNNFEVVMPRYEAHPLIFAGHPVHNLYLLYLAETGVVGLVGLLVVIFGLLRVAHRLARSGDGLIGGLGVGIVGVMVFMGLEELLSFSLREDVPLALYWLLAGLAVACQRFGPTATAMSGIGRPRPAQVRAESAAVRAGIAPRRTPRPGAVPPPGTVLRLGRRRTARPPAQQRGRHRSTARPSFVFPGLGGRGRRLLAVLGAGLVAVAVLQAPAAGGPAAAPVAVGPAPGGIVFQATVRATGHDAIFTAAADGSHVRQITPDDGRDYAWPRWAYGGHKIVYTIRSAQVRDTPTTLALMNPDGSSSQVISDFDYGVGQPRIDPTGTWLFFSALAPWYPKNSIFRMDLRTLQSVNLTAVSGTYPSLDADPSLDPDGHSLLLVQGKSDGADIVQMATDGTGRQLITHDAHWNTDPELSPDGRTVATSSYRGPGLPGAGLFGAKPSGYDLVLHDIPTGTERVLTQGLACSVRPAAAPCTPEEMSAYAPRFMDGGASVGWVGALDFQTTCICAIGVDGTQPRAVVSSTALAINWFDVSRADGATDWDVIGTRQPTSRVLATVSSGSSGSTSLVDASPDLMHRTAVSLPAGLQPIQARWSPDRSQIVFTARVPVPATPAAPHPAAPPGATRREHVTLDDLQPLAIALRADQASSVDAQEQIFLRSADGSVRQLTDPWTEDWRDGLVSGDARANTDPVFTPDGRAVVVTNTSGVSGESFLLRIDLQTGAVENLTNATSGAVPVADRSPAPSPDGSRIAFAWTNGGVTDVYTMNADGTDVRPAAAVSSTRGQPAWLPGSEVVVSIDDGGDAPALVRTDIGTGGTSVLVGGASGGLARPVPAPDGTAVGYLAPWLGVVNLYTVPLDGGTAAAVVQADPLDRFLDVDWR